MANEIRRRYNFLSGTIDDNPLSNSATTLNSTELASLAAVGSSEHVALILDPTGVGNGPEVVYVTAHTGSATSATIVRGREGTSGVQHASTITWIHAATAADYGTIGDDNDQPSTGGLPYEGQQYVDTTNNQLEIYDGSAWQRVAWYGTAGRCGGSWSRSTNLSVNDSTTTDLTFTTEATDTDGFLTPTSQTLTIPAGLGGIYVVDLTYTWFAGPNQGVTFAYKNGSVHHALFHGGNATVGASTVMVLAAADTVKFGVFQNSGGALNVTNATLNFYRIGI